MTPGGRERGIISIKKGQEKVIPTSLCSSSNAVHCSLAVRNCKEVVDYLQVLNSCCLLLLTSLHQYMHFEAFQVLSKLTTMSYSLTWRSSAFLFVLMVSLFLPPQMIGAQIFG